MPTNPRGHSDEGDVPVIGSTVSSGPRPLSFGPDPIHMPPDAVKPDIDAQAPPPPAPVAEPPLPDTTVTPLPDSEDVLGLRDNPPPTPVVAPHFDPIDAVPATDAVPGPTTRVPTTRDDEDD